MKRNSISNGPALMTGVILPRRPWLLCLLCLLCLCAAIPIRAATPPVTRSTSYNGAYSNIVSYAVQPWMNTNTVLLTVESWIYCADLNGDQAIIARNYRTR